MSSYPVQAAWCIPITQANYRAVYGRVGGHTEFSKDYFQIPGAAYHETVRLLMNGDDTVNAPIEYVWPGGSVTDAIRKASNEKRLRMSWPYSQAPRSWKPTLSPSESTVETFPGDPELPSNFTDPDDAAAAINKQWEDAKAAGISAKNDGRISAWAVAVKLRGEKARLHTRMYLEDPPAGYEWASTTLLPPELQEITQKGKTSAAVHVFETSEPLTRANHVIRRIFDALETGPNVLLTGPPGTGKTVALEDLRSIFEGQADGWNFDPSRNHDAWSWGRSTDDRSKKVISLVFHPSYSYENFVLGVFPNSKKAGDIEVVPGPLLELAHYAERDGHEGLLIIDEFNRGRAAAIFGDTLALLDEDKRSNLKEGIEGSQITRRYPNEEVYVSPDFRVGPKDLGEVPDQISLPHSLKIVAAMNSSDRSVAVLDSAMRRRFSILEVGPDYDALADHYQIDPTAPLPGFPSSSEDVKLMAYSLLKSLNQRIRVISGADFELGHALVWKVSGSDLDTALDSLAHAVDQRILSTMQMTYQDDLDVLGAILKADETSRSQPDASAFASWVDPPVDLEQYAQRSLYITSLLNTQPGDRWRLLLPLVQ